MLAERLKEGPSPFTVPFPRRVTFHDPCYLGKHNGIVEEPRELIRMVPGVTVKEMKMTRANSLCCGGGGGRMYAEVEEERRLAETRIGQAMDEGVGTILTACPWCRTMVANAIKDLQLEERIDVLDIAELLDGAMGEG
jgi:Fe-S oxidoreductase